MFPHHPATSESGLMYAGIKEAFAPIAPIAILVVIFQFVTGFMKPAMFSYWIAGSLLAGVGLFLFLRGVQLCLSPMGELIGNRFIFMPNMTALVLIVFLIGTLACAADPSVAVLNANVKAATGEHAPAPLLFLLIVTSGIGVLLVAGMMRIVWNTSPAAMLGGLVGLVLILSCVAPKSFVPLALDSGGVATGPLTVPFFLAIGLGFVSNLAGRSASSDGFGLLGIVALGPILGVLLLGLAWGDADTTEPMTLTHVADNAAPAIADDAANHAVGENAKPAIRPGFLGLLRDFLNIGGTTATVLRGIVPLMIIGWFVGVRPSRVSSEYKIRLLKGTVWTLIGLILFLQAVEVGFQPIAEQLGNTLAGIRHGWALVPAGLLLGLAVGLAEPSVHVLGNQVEEVTDGAIPKRLLLILMAGGVALAAALGMTRLVCGFSVLWIVIPGYLLIIALSFLCSRTFASIAYDASTVVTGPMLVTFLLVVAMGAADALEGRDRMTHGFGFVAIVAMVPVLVVMTVGAFNKTREKLRAKKIETTSFSE